MSTPAVILNSLTKVYGKDKFVAVDKISFSVERGECFGLIGPDGAGKTSILRMLTTLLLPNGGTASVNGLDVVRDYQEIRNTVGYMPGKFSLYQDLTVEENLNFFATLFGTTVSENYDLIRDIYIQIEKFKTRRAGKLSGGMKQKLALCCALIHKPTVLFLDEPTTGVDPVSRKEFWDMLARLKGQGITILVSTAYMDEATRCDKIGLIQQSRLLSVDTPENIIRAFPEKLFQVKAQNMYALRQCLQQYEQTLNSYTFGEYIHAYFKNEDEAGLRRHLDSCGLNQIEVRETPATVEDCFMKLMNNQGWKK
ncbi:MAG: ABC transporter ATP-binding protein [Chryseolinea sp.]